MDPLLSLAFSSISLELMPNAEGDGAGGDMASTTRASQPSKPVPEPSTPQYPLKKNKTKSNQIRARPKTRMEVAPCGLDDVGCAVLPHALARQQVWPQPSRGGCSARREWGSTTPCLSFPFYFTF